MSETTLVQVDLGSANARAVRTPVRSEVRAALLAAGKTVGEEMIEIRWGDDASGQPVLSERPAMIIIDDANSLVFGALPGNAVSAEAVSPDGGSVVCAIGEGVWLVVLPNNHRGADGYPVLFRDKEGAPINPGTAGRLATRADRQPQPAVSRLRGKFLGTGDCRLGRLWASAQHALGLQQLGPRTGVRLLRVRARRKARRAVGQPRPRALDTPRLFMPRSSGGEGSSSATLLPG